MQQISTTKKVLQKKYQRGDFMLTLTIALVIVAVLASIAIVAYQRQTRKTEIKRNQSEVTEIAAELQKNFGAQKNYGAVSTAIAVKTGTIPKDLRTPGTDTAQNSYGGAITADPVQLVTANDAAALGWANVPSDHCSDLVIGTSSIARRIRVAGTAVKAIDGTVNVATLTDQCESAARVQIIWDVGQTAS